MKQRVLIISLIVVTIIISLLSLKVYNDNKNYINYIKEIEYAYVNNKTNNLDVYDINNISILYNKTTEKKKKYYNYSYNKLVENISFDDVYNDNKYLLNNIDIYISKLESIKNDILDTFTLDNIKVESKNNSFILKNINNSIISDTKIEINKIYEENIKKFNELKEFLNNVNENNSNWRFSGNKLFVKTTEYKDYLSNMNKKYNIDYDVQNEIVLKSTKHVPIIMYHGINDITWGAATLFLKEKSFEDQMKYLYDNKFETIFLSEINDYEDFNKKVVLTFDDGYEDFYRIAYPLMKKYSIKSNLFVITGANGGKYVTHDQVKEMADSSLVEIGTHTISHPLLSQLSDENIEYELSKSKQTLEELTGKKVNTLAYPTGNQNSKVVSIAQKYFKYGVLMGTSPAILNSNTNYLKLSRIGIFRETSLEYFINSVNKGN